MTVASETNKQVFSCTGAVTYALPFYFISDSDITVYREDIDGVVTTLAITTDYTLSGAGDISGGTLTTVSAYTDGKLIVARDIAYTQGLDLSQGDGFIPDTLEQQLDKLVMMAQQLKRKVDLSFRLADSDTSDASTIIPTPAAGKTLRWDSSGTGLENAGVEEYATAIQSSNFTRDTYTDGVDFTTGVTTDLTMTMAPILETNTQVYFDGVYQSKTAYTISGTTITFSSPITATTVEIMVIEAVSTEGGTPADGSVTVDKIGTGAVTEPKIGNLAVTTNKIGANAVTEAKLDTAIPLRKMYVSSNDTTAGYLTDKLKNGTTGNLTFTETDATNETITVDMVRRYAHFQDQKTSGTVGDAITQNVWTTRTINTEVVAASWASLATNQITLDEGTYIVNVFASQSNSNESNNAIYNVTNTAYEWISPMNATAGTGQSTTSSPGKCVLVVAAGGETIELRTWCKNTGVGGKATSNGTYEVYADIFIEKIA